jgi:hypothetical protein
MIPEMDTVSHSCPFCNSPALVPRFTKEGSSGAIDKVPGCKVTLIDLWFDEAFPEKRTLDWLDVHTLPIKMCGSKIMQCSGKDTYKFQGGQKTRWDYCKAALAHVAEHHPGQEHHPGLQWMQPNMCWDSDNGFDEAKEEEAGTNAYNSHYKTWLANEIENKNLEEPYPVLPPPVQAQLADILKTLEQRKKKKEAAAAKRKKSPARQSPARPKATGEASKKSSLLQMGSQAPGEPDLMQGAEAWMAKLSGEQLKAMFAKLFAKGKEEEDEEEQEDPAPRPRKKSKRG